MDLNRRGGHAVVRLPVNPLPLGEKRCIRKIFPGKTLRVAEVVLGNWSVSFLTHSTSLSGGKKTPLSTSSPPRRPGLSMIVMRKYIERAIVIRRVATFLLHGEWIISFVRRDFSPFRRLRKRNGIFARMLVFAHCLHLPPLDRALDRAVIREFTRYTGFCRVIAGRRTSGTAPRYSIKIAAFPAAPTSFFRLLADSSIIADIPRNGYRRPSALQFYSASRYVNSL